MQNNIPIIAPVVRAPWLSLVIYGNFALFYALTPGVFKVSTKKEHIFRCRENVSGNCCAEVLNLVILY